MLKNQMEVTLKVELVSFLSLGNMMANPNQ